MSLSSICLNRFLLVAAGILSLAASAGAKETTFSPSREGRFVIAVLPVENLSGQAAPLRTIRETLIRQLRGKGFTVLPEEVLEGFIARNRVRYTGGVDESLAQALKSQTGADGFLVTSLELYGETAPPKAALLSRLVAAGETPRIEWTDAAGLAGDDAPGLLSLGLIEDMREIVEMAAARLAGSLAGHFGRPAGEDAAPSKFRPKAAYRSPALETGRKYTVAVVPFFNTSERKNAGEIVALHFVNRLKKAGTVEVLEPGVIRNAFLTSRIIMEEGLSLPQADALFAALDADCILTGKILDYRDYQGVHGKPKVNFSAQLIERRSRQVLWSSVSHNEGDDGVFFFDWGRVNTAHALASRMVRFVIADIFSERGVR